jgi:predicted GNAT superfamily acetyltransferase
VSEAVRDLDGVRQAIDAADAAAGAAGIEIAELHDMPRLEEAADLYQRVWSASPDEPIISASTLRALAHAGSYVAGASFDGRLLGAIVGFLGWRDGVIELHSHVLGVLEEARGRNVGFALKQHQRAWSLSRGITSVSWTFDPLVRRNAYFNLTKLGARVGEYHENFYGPMADAINGADDSDRMVVRWQLWSPEAVAASRRRAPDPVAASLERVDSMVLSRDDDGSPRVRTATGPTILAWLPEDIVEMRKQSPELAGRWRRALRETVGAALADGFTATGVSRDGWLLLERPT